MKHIKHFSVLFTLLLAMVMIVPACSDDKDDNKNGSKLVGTWVYIDSEDSERITFNANGTGTHYYGGSWGSDSETFRWTATETIVTLNYEDDSDPWIAPYSISADGKQLILDGELYLRQ
ncbi:MAG: lipocalin family protein [Paramuribaculum sp.]|nr:lipocalin family protein [Paramuribaculum sp.]